MDEGDDRGWRVAILLIDFNFRGIDAFAAEIRKRAGVRDLITHGLYEGTPMLPMLFFRKLELTPEHLDRDLSAVLDTMGPLFIESSELGRRIVIPTRNETVELRDVGLWHYRTASLKGGGKAGIELAEQWAIAMQARITGGEIVSACAQTTLVECCQTLFGVEGPTCKSLSWAIETLTQTWVYGAELSTVKLRCWSRA